MHERQNVHVVVDEPGVTFSWKSEFTHIQSFITFLKMSASLAAYLQTPLYKTRQPQTPSSGLLLIILTGKSEP